MLAGEAAGGVHRGSAPRSESLILVIAGGNHTIIYKAHFRSASPMPISLVTFLFGDKKVTLPYLLIYEKVYFSVKDSSRGMYFPFDGFCSVCYNDILKYYGAKQLRWRICL